MTIATTTIATTTAITTDTTTTTTTTTMTTTTTTTEEVDMETLENGISRTGIDIQASTEGVVTDTVKSTLRTLADRGTPMVTNMR